MLTVSTLTSEFATLIGWRQNIDPNGEQLSANTIQSDSGLYYNDFHPLLTVENLISIAPNYDAITGESHTFDDWLTEKTDTAIVRCVNDWVSKKILAKSGKSMIERQQAYHHPIRIDLLDNDNGQFVGLQIIPPESQNVRVIIEKIGLLFNASDTIPVKLFQSDKSAPIQTNNVSYSTANTIQWESVKWSLDGGNGYYLGYDQDAITAQSINFADHYDSNYPGLTRKAKGKFVTITPFSVDSDGSAMWGVSGNQYTLETNWGLNVQWAVHCDYTNLVVQQKDLFKMAIGYRVAIDLLREMAYNANARVNRNQANMDTAQILYEIDGDASTGGLKKEYKHALNAIMFDQNDIDPICLTCNPRGKTRFRTI